MSTHERDELDLTAAEYVLGTLDAEQTAAFERRLANESAARDRVAAWERRLAQLGLELEPVEPPGHVWDAVARHTVDKASPAANISAPAANDTSPLRRWRRVAIAASVAVVVLAGLAVAELPVWQGQPAAPTYASMIYDKSSGMSWLITSADQGRQLSVEAMGSYPVPSDKMLRMWIQAAGGKPTLIGRLPHTPGHYRMKVPKALRASLGNHSKVMVSLESRSRIGTTTPGGKLMWVAPLAHRTG